jgi:hypothetical protein
MFSRSVVRRSYENKEVKKMYEPSRTKNKYKGSFKIWAAEITRLFCLFRISINIYHIQMQTGCEDRVTVTSGPDKTTNNIRRQR